MPDVPPREAAKTKILRYFQDRIGKVVTTHDLAPVAGIRAYARRVRELRQEGWAIESHNDKRELRPGEYVMTSAERRPPAHEHAIPGAIRRQVLIRDGSTCQMCGAAAGDPHPTIHGRKLTLQVDHIDPNGPATLDNLRTLCSACHEGRANLEQPPREVLDALAMIRRAPRSIQESVYGFLKRKFG